MIATNDIDFSFSSAFCHRVVISSRLVRSIEAVLLQHAAFSIVRTFMKQSSCECMSGMRIPRNVRTHNNVEASYADKAIRRNKLRPSYEIASPRNSRVSLSRRVPFKALSPYVPLGVLFRCIGLGRCGLRQAASNPLQRTRCIKDTEKVKKNQTCL